MDFKDVATRHDLMAMEDLFDVSFNNGETYKDAKERVKDELERLKKEKKEREEERRKQYELIATQIKLFNREMSLAFKDVYYDWYKGDNGIWILQDDINKCVAVVNFREVFVVMHLNIEKTNRHIMILNEYSNVTDAIKYAEERLWYPKSYAYKNAEWKNEKPSEAQKKWCPWAKTKWDVNKYFNKNIVNGMVKKELLKMAD